MAGRPAWQKLWADVADTLARASATITPAKESAGK
jgi:hypothetical protein